MNMYFEALLQSKIEDALLAVRINSVLHHNDINEIKKLLFNQRYDKIVIDNVIELLEI